MSESAADRVIEAIKTMIKLGDLVPGQRLVEVEIAQMLSVSRQSIRQAFAALEAEGVISIERHRGARVRRYSASEVVALHQIREVLEGLAAFLVAERAVSDPSIVKRLAQIHKSAGKAAAAGDLPSYSDWNARLHEEIIVQCGNSEISKHISQANLAYFRLQRPLFVPDDLIRSHRQHEAIVDAIAEGRAALAERLMRSHIRSSRDVMLRAMRSAPDFSRKVAVNS